MDEQRLSMKTALTCAMMLLALPLHDQMPALQEATLKALKADGALVEGKESEAKSAIACGLSTLTAMMILVASGRAPRQGGVAGFGGLQ